MESFDKLEKNSTEFSKLPTEKVEENTLFFETKELSELDKHLEKQKKDFLALYPMHKSVLEYTEEIGFQSTMYTPLNIVMFKDNVTDKSIKTQKVSEWDKLVEHKKQILDVYPLAKNTPTYSPFDR